jgi:hypothetical protein
MLCVLSELLITLIRNDVVSGKLIHVWLFGEFVKFKKQATKVLY